MSVKYKLYREKRENSKNFGKYYARATMTDVCSLREISERIQRNCSMKASDVNAVLTELVEVMRDELLASHRVKIDGFGSFKVGLHTTPAESVAKFDAKKNIVGARVNFLPAVTTTAGSGRVKNLLSGLQIREYSAYDDMREKTVKP